MFTTAYETNTSDEKDEQFLKDFEDDVLQFSDDFSITNDTVQNQYLFADKSKPVSY